MSEQTNELTINSSTMVEENFEIHHPQMVDTTLLFVHHSNLFKFTILKWLRLHFDLSITVGDNFKIHYPQMARNALLLVHHGWRKFWNSPSSHGWNYTSICQTWLEMFLKFTILKWLKLHFHSSPMIGENFEVQHPQIAETSLLFVNYGLRKFRNSLSLNVWSYTSICQP